MLRWTGTREVPEGFGPSVVTVGVFDGVHRGHAATIERAVTLAAGAGATPVVVTFDPNPLAVLRPAAAPLVVSTLAHRLELLAALLDRRREGAALVLPFTPELAAQSAPDFVAEVLVGALRAQVVVIGENFRFGHRAAGDVALLRSLGAEHGFDVQAVPLTGRDGATWSSTRVRERIAVGDVEAAAQILGRPHRVEGTVVLGDRRGRELGYPTANLETAPHAAVPGDGVYAGWLLRAGVRLPAAISVGTNPTFDGTQRRVEAYVLDRDDLDLYGERVALDFAARLRDTVRFDGVDALLAQVGRDVERTRELTRPAPQQGN